MEKRIVSKDVGKYGMVSTASAPATKAGVEILKAGGNAFDAAIAIGYALGVSEPQASGIGGQSMALIYHAKTKKYAALDGSSYAPYHFQPASMPESPVKSGLRATTLPSSVAFYGYLLDAYGSMPIHEVLNPAITLCEEGVEVTPLIHRLLKANQKELLKDATIARRFFKDGAPLTPGALLVQPELASCMRRLSEAGWKDFYTGATAERIVQDMERRGGWLRQEDFSQIPIPLERPVLTGKYRKYGIVTFPPPGAGRVLIQVMNILEHFEAGRIDLMTPYGNLVLALAFQLTLSDRRRLPQHPDIYFQKTQKTMRDKTYAAEVTATIEDLLTHLDGADGPPVPKTSGETTHFSVADRFGNIVSVTQSIELVFGAKRMADSLGFFYNNYMNAFDYKDRTHPYYLLPRNRPWSSVAPTIITVRKRPRLVLGSPGSARISTTLAQVLLRYLDQGFTLEDAIAAPRFHTSHEKRLQLEHPRFEKSVADAFEHMGFKLKKRDAYSFYLGCVQAIELPHGKNRFQFVGVADPRRDGTASAPRGKAEDKNR
ncbi:MAG: gamma-glutamyltransferase [Candidatus Izemoplasmataceae bacterium]